MAGVYGGDWVRLDYQDLYSPRYSLGLKRSLLQLNYDLDDLKANIDFVTSYESVLYGYSIDYRQKDLSVFEKAVLYLEDRRFFVHGGFEIYAIPRVIKRLLKGRGVGGISTIEQQFVRIITKRYERRVSRKVKEILLAFLINFHCSKRKILSAYINRSYFGYRLTGCEAASIHLYGKAAIDLNWDESIFIACLLPLPLPKAIFQNINLLPLAARTPLNIIGFSKDISPRWASRVSARYRLAQKGYTFRPKRR
jgi:membrane carboxypeptidase/penicillin-binding protein PbpC